MSYRIKSCLDELNKIASLAGQDLRKPFTGMTTNFPTADSKTVASKLLSQSSSATMGHQNMLILRFRDGTL